MKTLLTEPTGDDIRRHLLKNLGLWAANLYSFMEDPEAKKFSKLKEKFEDYYYSHEFNIPCDACHEKSCMGCHFVKDVTNDGFYLGV